MLSAFGIISCEDQFLEKDKLGEETSETYFINQDKAVASLTAAYSDLKDYRFGWFNWAFGETLSDNSIYGGSDSDNAGFQPLKSFSGTPDMYQARYKWQLAYRGVNKSNQAIEGIEKMDDKLFDSPEYKKRLIAEARFLRAYYHFELVRGFGRIPIIDHLIKMPNDRIQMSDPEDVFAFIVSELELAEPHLPLKDQYAADDLGRITKGAARALLAKTCLYLEDWKAAYDWSNKIMADQQYQLTADYAKLFTLAGEHGTESIFEISFFNSTTESSAVRNNGNFQTLFQLPRNITYGYGINLPTQNLVDAFDAEGDEVRKKATILTTQEVFDIELEAAYEKLDDVVSKGEVAGIQDAYDVYMIALEDKFGQSAIDVAQEELYSAINTAVGLDVIEAKLADIEKLDEPEMDLALAYRELVDGQNSLTFNRTGYFNKKIYLKPEERSAQIRNNPNNIIVLRYGEIYLIAAEAAYHLSKEGEARDLLNDLREMRDLPRKEAVAGADLLEAIYIERRLELAMENDRYHDLLRTNRASILPGWTEAKKYWPVPQAEIDNSLGEITQNPGY